MRSWTIAFALGICLSILAPELIPFPLYLLLLILPLISLRIRCLRTAGAASLGIFWFILSASNHIDKIIPAEIEGQTLHVKAEILSMPEQAEHHQRFIIAINQYCPADGFTPCIEPGHPINTRISVYHPLAVEPGQQWQFEVKLKRPHGFANPGLFDYEAWLFQQGFNATGYIRQSTANKLLAFDTGLINSEMWRYRFRTQLEALAADHAKIYDYKQLNLIKALTIGDRYNLSSREWKLFTFTGTNHLIVISGLHIGLVCLAVYRICIVLLGRAFPSLFLYIPSGRLGVLSGTLAALFFSLISGFGLPVQRALIMCFCLCLGHLICRKTRPQYTLLLALLVILIVEPMAPLNSGFWLSFCAVGILVFVVNHQTWSISPSTSGLKPRLITLIKAQLLVSALLAPVLLYFFQQASLVAPLVNFLAIPYVSFLVVPLCLAGLITIWFFPTVANLCFSLADYLLYLMVQCFKWLQQCLPDSLIAMALPVSDFINFRLLVISLLIMLIIWPWINKIPDQWKGGKYVTITLAALIATSGILVARPTSIKEGQAYFTVLDVGQGLSIIIQTANHSLIYDAGPDYSDSFNAGSDLLVPFLRLSSINKIDTLIVSHTDNDHAGGLPGLLAAMPVDKLYSPTESIKGIPSSLCQTSQPWQWDGVDFDMIHPQSSDRFNGNDNNSSCVLRVRAGQHTVLLPGDIEKQAELHLLATRPSSLAADLLIAPHHGSKTSSTRAFLEAVSPRWVIVSSGYRNRFRHPHPDVIARYLNMNISVINTADSGATTFLLSSSAGLSTPAEFRKDLPRIWRKP